MVAVVVRALAAKQIKMSRRCFLGNLTRHNLYKGVVTSNTSEKILAKEAINTRYIDKEVDLPTITTTRKTVGHWQTGTEFNATCLEQIAADCMIVTRHKVVDSSAMPKANRRVASFGGKILAMVSARLIRAIL